MAPRCFLAGDAVAMSELPTGNPRLPEHINNPPQNQLAEFARLVLMVGIAMVALSVLVVVLTGLLAPKIPFRWERAAVPALPISNNWPEAQQALQQLADALMTQMPEQPRIPVTVHLLDSSQPNAFATLGGHVVVTRALLDTLDTENALAMVLAHEIGHIQHRDPIAALSRGAVLSLLWAALLGREGFAMQSLFSQTGGLTLLSFNRDMERHADSFALQMLDHYYGHSLGADSFFLHMQQQLHETEWQGWFHTHPLTSERLHKIERHTHNQRGEQQPLPASLQALRRSSHDA